MGDKINAIGEYLRECAQLKKTISLGDAEAIETALLKAEARVKELEEFVRRTCVSDYCPRFGEHRSGCGCDMEARDLLDGKDTSRKERT